MAESVVDPLCESEVDSDGDCVGDAVGDGAFEFALTLATCEPESVAVTDGDKDSDWVPECDGELLGELVDEPLGDGGTASCDSAPMALIVTEPLVENEGD